jgi:putative glutamine amidotransferase
MLGHHAYHVVGSKYVEAVRLAGCQPLVVPSASVEELDTLLDLADGLFLTGSPSNVHPEHFGEGVHDPSLPLDAARDAWTLPLIPKALTRGVPLFAICRGAQETNVALGGSLYQAVEQVPGFNDHRDDDDAPVEVQYGPAHGVTVASGGVLARVLDRMSFDVNSLHGQAVNRLAPGLVVEARSPDGVIEAFSKPEAPGFNLCVQWHPEWQAESNPVSMQILAAFGAACREFRTSRQQNR